MTMSDDIIIACPSCKKQMDVRVGQKRVQCPYCGAIFRKKSRLEKGMDAWLERRTDAGKKRRKEKEVEHWREELDRQEGQQPGYSHPGSEETRGQSKKEKTIQQDQVRSLPSKPRRPVWMTVLIVVGAVIFIGVVVPIMSPHGGGSKVRRERIAAMLGAQAFVKDRLVSPSSADFGGWFGQDAEDCVTALGGGRYSVCGWVDSQNRFGVTVRSNFRCTLRNVGKYQWRCESVDIMER